MVDVQLAEAIARGEVTLLDIDTIAKRLNISRSTFERWLRNGKAAGGLAGSNLASYADRLANQQDGNTTFPGPDVMVGKSPRWEEKTLVSWLIANTKRLK